MRLFIGWIYIFQFTVVVPFGSSNMKLKLPLIIGTIPLAIQLPPQLANDLPGIASPSGDIETSPAPSGKILCYFKSENCQSWMTCQTYIECILWA